MGTVLRELAMFAPSILLFALLATCPTFLPPLDRAWLFLVSFLLIELPACVIVACGTQALLHHGNSGFTRLRRDCVLLACAIFLLLLLPAWIGWITHRPAFALDAAFAFLPRLTLLWRVRDSSEQVIRTAKRCALVGPCVFAAFLLLLPMLGCSAGVGFSGPAALIATYYLVCGLGSGLLQLHASIPARTASWHWL